MSQFSIQVVIAGGLQYFASSSSMIYFNSRRLLFAYLATIVNTSEKSRHRWIATLISCISIRSIHSTWCAQLVVSIVNTGEDAVKCISRFEALSMEPSTLRWTSTRNHWLETGSSAQDIVQLSSLQSFKITDSILLLVPMKILFLVLLSKNLIEYMYTQRGIDMDFPYHSNWIETHLYFFLLRSVVSTLCLREVSWLWPD